MTLPDAAVNELLEALDREFERECIQPGDITKHTLATRWDISDNAAKERMIKLAKRDPSWAVLTVWDASTRHEVTVLRKVA